MDEQSLPTVIINDEGIPLTSFRIQSLKPYDSWVFDEEKTKWVAPKPKPDAIIGETDENGVTTTTVYNWDEEKLDWVPSVINLPFSNKFKTN